MYLFVYGTLKKGYRNNCYLEDQKFIQEAETEPYYRLFDNGYFPMLIEDGEGYSISGEIWRVKDREIIRQLDIHEVLYKRKCIEITDFDRKVWAYFYKKKIDDSLYECSEGVWP